MDSSYLSLIACESCSGCWINTRRIREIDFIGLRLLIDIGGDHITIEMRKQNGSIKLITVISVTRI